jgi:thiol-disulfide isomerase/thioredoxin
MKLLSNKLRNIACFLPLIFAGIFICSSCNQPSEKLNVGMWRGALLTESGAEVPFNFEVKDSLGHYEITIINSSERFVVDEITINGDSIHIQMPLFDSEINGILVDGKIEGIWTKHLATKVEEMSFYANAGVSWRIKEKVKPATTQISGKWASTFISSNQADTTIAIGDFVQNNEKVTGTFLTATGDYRYLEGVIDGNQLSLSTFDGSHAFLFTATVKGNQISDGKFYSGFSYVESWLANKDNKATLPDAYSLTFLKPGFKKIDFTFPDLNKQSVSLKDVKFKNKVVIIQMLGSWCPNCMDESAFLAQFYEKYQDKDVAIIGLAYERTTDFERSKKSVERLKNRFNIKYDLLITGFTKDKEDAAKSLPMLNNVIAFPTLIIQDKKGNVRKIHTGFSGPGTGKNYTEFVAEFEQLVNDLLKEN